jgi:uncharacterized protein (TIRG00374 family)
MDKKVFIGLSIIAGIAALWIILKVIPIQEVFMSFTNSSPRIIIGFLFASIGIMVSLAWRWKVVLRSQKIDIPLLKLFNYRLIGYGISYLTPAAKLGGEPVRAALLGRHGVNFSKALSSVVIDKTIELSASGFFFFIGVLTILFCFRHCFHFNDYYLFSASYERERLFYPHF